jgi:hypothetical protein
MDSILEGPCSTVEGVVVVAEKQQEVGEARWIMRSVAAAKVDGVVVDNTVSLFKLHGAISSSSGSSSSTHRHRSVRSTVGLEGHTTPAVTV